MIMAQSRNSRGFGAFIFMVFNYGFGTIQLIKFVFGQGLKLKVLTNFSDFNPLVKKDLLKNILSDTNPNISKFHLFDSTVFRIT